MCAALWGVFNSVFSPIFFQFTGMPFLCDLIGFSVLSVAIWWTKKFGTIIFIGVLATVINFTINPGGIYFFGFTASTIVFDIIIFIIGYDRKFRGKSLTAMFLVFGSILSAGVAGYVIGLFFLPAAVLVTWGGVLGWAGLHAFGGMIGGIIGVGLIWALTTRSVLREIK
jgi:hypothetical protein